MLIRRSQATNGELILFINIIYIYAFGPIVEMLLKQKPINLLVLALTKYKTIILLIGKIPQKLKTAVNAVSLFFGILICCKGVFLVIR